MLLQKMQIQRTDFNGSLYYVNSTIKDSCYLLRVNKDMDKVSKPLFTCYVTYVLPNNDYIISGSVIMCSNCYSLNLLNDLAIEHCR